MVAELAALAAAGAEGTSERGGGGGCRRITASVHRSRDASSGSTRRSSSASTESGSCSDDNIVVQDTCSNGSSTAGLSALGSVELVAGVGALAATSKRYLREIAAPGMLQASESASLAGATFSDFAAANKFGEPLTRR